MLFINLSATLLGLATLSSAVPHPQVVPEVVGRDTPNMAERGLVWVPRALQERKNNQNSDITITDTEITQLTEIQQGSETQLTVAVEKQVVIKKGTKNAKDNVRKNHFAAINTQVNTIVVVVTQIIDQRDSNNVNTRYMTHQVKANNANAVEEIQIMVTEAQAITIGAQQVAQATGINAQLQASAASANAVAAMATADPNAPFAASNATMLLPSGASAPTMDNVSADPANIVEEEQTTLFVQQITEASN